jgi:protein TonB
MTQKKAERKIIDSKAAKPRTKATAVDIIKRSMEVASLDVELQQRHQAYANRPRVKFITASTREYKYATYMEAWRSKVERIGRLNYPEEAKRRKLYGSLLLDVAINPDGSIQNITLQRSSGVKLLDEAAINIVRLAAPFAKLPDNIRKETDVLHIQRTWIFKSGNRLHTK